MELVNQATIQGIQKYHSTFSMLSPVPVQSRAREPKQLPRQGWNIKSNELTTQPNICICMISDRASEVLAYVCCT